MALFLVVVAGMFFLTWDEPSDGGEGTSTVASQASTGLTPEQFFKLAHNWEGSRAGDGSECMSCHGSTTPGIYYDWLDSEHAREDVTCIDCHEAEPTDPDAMSHYAGYTISPVVSPLDCSGCHSQETDEFNVSLHAFGSEYYEFLYDREKLPYLESHAGDAFLEYQGVEMDHAATLNGCQGCHGTNMTGKSKDDFTVWPNNGIGRINPDGSKGSCASCHTRHAFSQEEARKPETCGQCHLGPDHPQMEIYMESKHGNIYASEGDTWNWSGSGDEWEAGIDYRAPTCSACHMSAAGSMSATHDVSSRLSWELETPVSRHTDNTANSLGVPISDGSTWQEKRERMQTVCLQCHSPTWVENFYDQGDVAVELYNAQYNESKAVVDALVADGLLTPESFDEPIEFEIYEMWHHEGRRARMGAFMMGPDYVQWHGFYDLLIGKVEIEHMAQEIRDAVNDSGMELPETYVLVFLAANGFDGEVYLTWDFAGPEIADHYNLYWSTTPLADVTFIYPNAMVNTQTHLVEGLTEDTTYYFAVAAVNEDGEIMEVSYSSAVPTSMDGGSEDDDDDDEGDSPAPSFVMTALAIVGLAAVAGRMGRKR